MSSSFTHSEKDIESAPVATHPRVSNGTSTNGAVIPGSGNALQYAPYQSSIRQFADPAPFGLCGFAFTTFVLSLINANASGVAVPAVVVGPAYAYGGFVQLLAGAWEMASGNTFGATAFTSYGAFWISWALIETEGLGLIAAYDGNIAEANHAVGFFLAGWFIFTFILLTCTLKSSIANFSLFFFLDLTFLLLTVAHFQQGSGGSPSVAITKAAGIVGLITAFIAWYNAIAGISSSSNSFFKFPLGHFPWSDQARNVKASHID